jgi:ATP-dependent Clp protease ATP-binding subunit ClpA
MPTFSQSLEQSLHRALAIANERHHQYATLEHLLLDDAKPTAGFQRVIQRAVIHVQSSGREEVTGANVLVAIFAERESHAAYFLQEQDMTRYDAVNYISHGIAKRPGVSEARPCAARAGAEPRSGREAEPKNRAEALEAYCVNLNEKAKERQDRSADRPRRRGQPHHPGAVPPPKNNPLFVGDPGVGKTAIAEGLARKRSSKRRAGGAEGTPPSIRSTWARCWPARAIAATSRSG